MLTFLKFSTKLFKNLFRFSTWLLSSALDFFLFKAFFYYTFNSFFPPQLAILFFQKSSRDFKMIFLIAHNQLKHRRTQSVNNEDQNTKSFRWDRERHFHILISKWLSDWKWGNAKTISQEEQELLLKVYSNISALNSRKQSHKTFSAELLKLFLIVVCLLPIPYCK